MNNDIWFTGMSDFYNGMETKIDHEVESVMKALNALIAFLETKSAVEGST